MRHVSKLCILYIVGLAVTFVLGWTDQVEAQEVTLNIAWAEWPPADFLVELSKGGTSNSPMGPFQRTVLLSLIIPAKVSAVSEPMSRPA